jgi:hypothetical protein
MAKLKFRIKQSFIIERTSLHNINRRVIKNQFIIPNDTRYFKINIIKMLKWSLSLRF